MNCMIFGKVGVRGFGYGWGYMVSLARHVHGEMVHVHWSSQCGDCNILGSRILVPCIDESIGSCVFV